MGIELAKAYIRIGVDASKVRPGLEETRGHVNSALFRIGGMTTKMMGALGLAVGVGAFGKLGFEVEAAAEQARIAFGVMLGSAKEAQATLERLVEFAAKTPFEMPEITQAARGLIQFGERGDQLMTTLTMLGNAASATSTDFGFVASVFNQVRGVGKLLTQDFRQLSTRGILSLQDIAKHFGVTTEAAQSMLSHGRISFEDFREILEQLSAEGGRFGNMMALQSESMAGLYSTMRDNFNLMAGSVMSNFEPAAKAILKGMSKAFEATGKFLRLRTEFAPMGRDLLTVADKAKLAAERIQNAVRIAAEQAKAARKAYVDMSMATATSTMNKFWEPMSVLAANYRKIAEEQRAIVEGTKDWQKAIDDLRKRSGPSYLISGQQELANAAREAETWTNRGKAMGWLNDTAKAIENMRLGVDDFATAFRDIAMAPGVTDEQLQRMDQMYRQFRQARELVGLREFGKQLSEQIKTPVEKAREELEKLDQARALGIGRGGISTETYARRIRELQLELRPEPVLAPGRYEFADFGRQIQDAFLRRDDPTKITAEEAKKHTELQTRMAASLKVLEAKPVGLGP